MGIEIPALYKGHAGTFSALLRWGSESQKRRYLPLLATKWVGAYAMSEEDAGSDAFAISTSAEKSGDDFVINGRKYWTTNYKEAELFLIFAKTQMLDKTAGITAFIVERSYPGLTIGKEVNKLGIRASSTGELILHNVHVSQENVLGRVGEGSVVAVETLNEGRIGIAAQLLGLAQGAHSAALAYAQKRQQFGRQISSFQGVHFPLAHMATEIEATRLLVYNAARITEKKNATAMERLQTSAMAKYFASQVAEKVASEALEIFGGNGYIKDFPAEKFYRDAKIGKIYEGTSNIQLRTIATTILQGKQDKR
ncbi:MAG: acyl-CoA dehydrogenase [Chloroflexi bacterium]|nr:MAG: acyl-CoA dehydrogenase [Chloroflexota bacterium]